MDKPSIFSQIPKEDWYLEGQCFFVIRDRYPVSPGHSLIISKKLRRNFFELTHEEKSELSSIIELVRQKLDSEFSSDGYNIGMNCGKAAGQTVFHFHCHIIPRYKGDMADSSGGVRHYVAGKGYY